MGVAMLLERLRPRVAAAVGGAIIAFAVADALIPLKFDAVLLPHPAYRLLATLPDGPLLEMPVYSRALGFRRTRYMLDSTWHWKPLVDAYSDYIPPDFDTRSEVLADFPSLDALADMKRDQVRYVMVHLEPYAGPMRDDLDRRITGYSAFLRELYRDRDLVLVEVVKYP